MIDSYIDRLIDWLIYWLINSLLQEVEEEVETEVESEVDEEVTDDEAMLEDNDEDEEEDEEEEEQVKIVEVKYVFYKNTLPPSQSVPPFIEWHVWFTTLSCKPLYDLFLKSWVFYRGFLLMRI